MVSIINKHYHITFGQYFVKSMSVLKLDIKVGYDTPATPSQLSVTSLIRSLISESVDGI